MSTYIALKILSEERDKLVREQEQEQLRQRNPSHPGQPNLLPPSTSPVT